MKKQKSGEFKCVICGRFVGINTHTKIIFIPDSEYSEETIKYVHKTCGKRQNLI